jgi:AmmeMemoRadiSam system protein B/AmmeMemoRadiSam system protein A
MKRKIIFFLLLLTVMFMAAENIRPFLTTGSWYPADPQRLSQMLSGFFEQSPVPDKTGTLRGIIAPHAGFGYSGLCAARAYSSLSPAQGIRRVILLGASHRSGFYGACVADYTAWATPLGQVAVDTEICRSLSRENFFRNDNAAMQNEHSLENQLPFLQRILGHSSFKIIPILFGTLRKKDFSKMAAILSAYCDEKTLLVASSDLTHYGENFAYTPFKGDIKKQLTILDEGFIEAVQKLDFENYFRYSEKTGITACGIVPIGVMIRMFAKHDIRCTLTDYYKSGDLNNDYSSCVSYASLVFCATDKSRDDPIGLSLAEQKLLLELARSTLRSHLEKIPLQQQNENQFSACPKLGENLGVFVTLRKKGALRGCIGSIIGVEPLYRGVMKNAVSAAVQDPRFQPLQGNELKSVEIEISVMTPLQLVSDYRSIRLGTDGVVIRDSQAQAVFLPQVAAETGWTLDQFMGSLCVKAGLARGAYKRSRTMQFYVFQALVFSEKDRQK